MKSTKKSSLFTNNPTIPEMEEYVEEKKIFFRIKFYFFIIEKILKQQLKKYLVQHYH